MGKVTEIPWCDSTLNLVMGCSAGCELSNGICFAERWCRRLAGRPGYPKDFRKPELFPHRLAELRRWPNLTGTKRPDKPWLDGMPRVVFLNDLGETFDPALPAEWLVEPRAWLHRPAIGRQRRAHREQTSVYTVLSDSPHTFIILTKQPRRMHDFFATYPCPPNVWPGVSVTTQATADERVPWLQGIDAKVRVISHEPALGPVNWSEWTMKGRHGDWPPSFDWLISGGESGPGARLCDLAWLRFDRNQRGGLAWFLKAVGARPCEAGGYRGVSPEIDGRPMTTLKLKHPAGADESEWPADLQGCRQVPRLTAAAGKERT